MKRLIFLFLLAPFVVTCAQYALLRDGGAAMGDEKIIEDHEKRLNTAVHAVLEASEGKGIREIESLLYRDAFAGGRVVDFYSGLTDSRDLAEIILHHAEKNDIPFSLAFALAWAESSYNPRAVNRNRTSTDRGLFQLNSNSFPHLGEEEFFDPVLNTKTGIAYLRSCLDLGGNEIVALAMYNAGRTRVSREGAPRMTLDYIAKILEYRGEIENRFYQTILPEKNQGVRVAGILDTEAVNK